MKIKNLIWILLIVVIISNTFFFFHKGSYNQMEKDEIQQTNKKIESTYTTHTTTPTKTKSTSTEEKRFKEIRMKENKFILITKTKTNEIPFIAVHDPQRCSISREIMKNGVWESEYTKFLIELAQLVPFKNSVIDIGSNIGDS